MKVVDLHPEDLLDKEAKGTLSESERTRLARHLERCSTCRVESQLRADFREELEEDAEIGSQRLIALIEGMPRATEELPVDRTSPPAPFAPPVPRPAPTPRTRRAREVRRAARIALLAAAAVLVGSLATAMSAPRVWARVVATLKLSSLAESSEPEVRPRSPLPQPLTAPPMVAVTRSTPASEPAASPESSSIPPPPEPVAPASAPAAVWVAPVATVATPVAPPGAAPSVIALPVPARAPESVESAAVMFEAANEARRAGDYARAIVLHRRLQGAHPQSRESHTSLGTLGRLLLDRGDAAGALASFDAYLARGRGPVDEAVLVGRATALERLGRSGEARDAWRALLDAFPDTPYREHARNRAGPAP